MPLQTYYGAYIGSVGYTCVLEIIYKIIYIVC